jgi:hypothetical protein
VSVLKNVLALPKYAVSDPVYLNKNIDKNEIKFCDPKNLDDAKALKNYLESVQYNPFVITNIAECDPIQSHNTLEVWLNSAAQ